ncbi:M48 family metalloprotease [Streptomyces sp. NPDC058066]|uniref:M48 family metalloprotease n=1 Tax=Streptomyces sp. NPDC058066 TaxID=3346323 RepID=UPI0036EF36F3
MEADTYKLVIENSTDLNAMAAVGHVVGVTTYALNRIPSGNLAVVLAHELGHHTGGHAWAGLLGYRSSLPGSGAWPVPRGLAGSRSPSRGPPRSPEPASCTSSWAPSWCPASSPPGTSPSLSCSPRTCSPPRAGAVSCGPISSPRPSGSRPRCRRSCPLPGRTGRAEGSRRRAGQEAPRPGGLAKLLSSHPDNYTRLRALEPCLQPIR